jgi:hypothetical protein
MGVSTFVGLRCPFNHETVNVSVHLGGGEPRCSVCGAIMVTDEKSPGATANAYCPTCKTYAGLTTGTRCPTCGGAYTALPR